MSQKTSSIEKIGKSSLILFLLSMLCVVIFYSTSTIYEHCKLLFKNQYASLGNEITVILCVGFFGTIFTFTFLKLLKRAVRNVPEKEIVRYKYKSENDYSRTISHLLFSSGFKEVICEKDEKQNEDAKIIFYDQTGMKDVIGKENIIKFCFDKAEKLIMN